MRGFFNAGWDGSLEMLLPANSGLVTTLRDLTFSVELVIRNNMIKCVWGPRGLIFLSSLFSILSMGRVAAQSANHRPSSWQLNHHLKSRPQNRCKMLWNARQGHVRHADLSSSSRLESATFPSYSVLRHGTAEPGLMASFYDGLRYKQKEFPERYLRSGRSLMPNEYEVVNYEGTPLTGFYQFHKRGFGDEYAASFGVSIVLLRQLRKNDPQVATQSWDALVQQELRLPDFLTSRGLRVSQTLGWTNTENGLAVVKSYEEGPTLLDLVNLRDSGKLSFTEWNAVLAKYKEFMAKFAAILTSPEYLSFAREQGLPDNLHLRMPELSYVEGTWTLIGFAD